jgi:hypothetical protein
VVWVWCVCMRCVWCVRVCVCCVCCVRGTFETLGCSLCPCIATSFPCLETTAGNDFQKGISVGLLLTRALERWNLRPCHNCCVALRVLQAQRGCHTFRNLRRFAEYCCLWQRESVTGSVARFLYTSRFYFGTFCVHCLIFDEARSFAIRLCFHLQLWSYSYQRIVYVANNKEAAHMSGLKNPISQPIRETSFIWFLLISKGWAKQYIYISCFMYLFKHIKIWCRFFWEFPRRLRWNRHWLPKRRK